MRSGKQYRNKIYAYINSTSKEAEDYIRRLEFARDNNCNTVMLTGECEPQQNMTFLTEFGEVNRRLSKPFRNIEIQTTGVKVINELYNFKKIGISTISLSISSLVDDELNNEIIGVKYEKNLINLEELTGQIYAKDFNLRLSLNITKNLMKNEYPDYKNLFLICKKYHANQVTFRKMFSSGLNTEQDKWIEENRLKDENAWFYGLANYIKTNGNYIDTLEYGNDRYSLDGMSIVVDDDCMAKRKNKRAAKYLILRPDCRLYSKWDDPGSLIF